MTLHVERGGGRIDPPRGYKGERCQHPQRRDTDQHPSNDKSKSSLSWALLRYLGIFGHASE
jgi:hypothetical protein